MFKVVWDKETNGVRLSSKITPDTLGVSPRPVFFEELDLLNMKQFGWNYPHCKEPLLWACNKQYFYKGEIVFEVKGANIYDNPVVLIRENSLNIDIMPVNVSLMLERCRDEMFLIESEAIEFIHETYLQYSLARNSVKNVAANQLDYELLAAKAEKKFKKKMAIVKEDCDSFDIVPLADAEKLDKKIYQTTKIDKFIASFSGGKDSMVVLDLCTRAIPSTDFEVIYSDTGYELPSSLKLYEAIQEYYGKHYPDLKFSIARNHESVLNYWDMIGTPSDTHRWCCAVMKTAPLYRMLKVDGNKQAKVVAFEGVRSEESFTRSNYERIGKGVKHDSVINARPILNWNTTEIFLYGFKHDLTLNEAYRYGKPRVGCLICPFSSPWDDMIVNKYYHEELKPFLNRLVEWSKARHIPNLDEYIKEHKWKLRASGNSLNSNVKVSFISQFPVFIAQVSNAKNSLELWLPVIGSYSLANKGSKSVGELQFNKNVYSFEIISTGKNSYKFTLNDVKDVVLVSMIKKVIYKSAYCISCEACEVECPTGALSVYPKVIIDKIKCIHCYKCLNFHDYGCIVANSLLTTMENKNKGGLSRIGTFGIHEEWLDEYFALTNDFWGNNSLGKKQEDSFKAWLKDAGIIDGKRNITEFGEFCKEHYIDDSSLVWEIIWINFAYDSTLVHWFINEIHVDRQFDKPLLDQLALETFDGTKNTITYAIGGFMQIFKYSPIGEDLMQGVCDSNKTYIRQSHVDISDAAFAYSIYKYADSKGVKSLRVNDFYQGWCETGPAKEFCLPKSIFERMLRKLNSASNRVLIAELNMGLDSITLRDDLNAMLVLKQLTV